jgi:hypothetical protein
MKIVQSAISALAWFFGKLFDLTPGRKLAQRSEPDPARVKLRWFAEYKNPFFTGNDGRWPPEQIIIYSYEAVQVWAGERGTAASPEETASEFCGRLGEHCPELEETLNQLASLYAHAAYGIRVPPNSDLEPIRKLWHNLSTTATQAVDLSQG